MRKGLFISILVLLSCSENEVDPNTGMGCLTAIDKEDPTEARITIRCCTRKEYLAGSNVSAGGTSYWNSYKLHEWSKCEDCQ